MRIKICGRFAWVAGLGLLGLTIAKAEDGDSISPGNKDLKDSKTPKVTPWAMSLPWAKGAVDKSTGANPKATESSNGKARKGKDLEAYDELEVSLSERKVALQNQAALRLQEEQDYFRRLEVCDRLMVEAVRNGDADAQRRIEQQQDRIQEIYNGRTAFIRLPEGSRKDLAILQEKSSSQTSNTSGALLKASNSAATGQNKVGKTQTASLKEGL